MSRTFSFMGIQIRKMLESDLPTVFELMAEFAEYEKLLAYLEIKQSSYISVMFGPKAFVDGLVACDEDETLGYAIFYPCFATFRSSPGMFLEDLFVSARARGKGVGDMLLRAVARQARSRDLERIDIWVLDWNAPAIEFYKKRGADCESADRHFRFVDAAFERLAQ